MWKNLCARAAWHVGFLWEIQPVQTCTIGDQARLLAAAESSERLKEIRDQTVEIPVGFSHLLDLLDRVNNRGMVLSPETPSDLRQRRVRQRLAEVHRNLSRQRDRLGIVL